MTFKTFILLRGDEIEIIVDYDRPFPDQIEIHSIKAADGVELGLSYEQEQHIRNEIIFS